MANRFLDDSARLQLRQIIPADTYYKTRMIRAQLCAGSALPYENGFAVHQANQHTPESWVATIGDFDFTFGLEGQRIQPNESPHVEIRPPSLNTKSITEKTERQPATWLEFTNLLSRSFIAPTTGTHTRRPYASAGGLYTVQVFALRRTNTHWDRYHLLPNQGALERFSPISHNVLSNHVTGNELIDLADIDFILGFGIIPELTIAKYQLRGYKFALFEIGEMIQQSASISATLSIHTRAYGHSDELGAAALWDLNADEVWIEHLQLFTKVNNATD
ncbi:hypothetical protein [Corynebacterium sp.]|uniref:hypothetical protein n=1 Tax=Corynebacterium sp. TaxID=1720 RepID=UPI0026DADF62|nr:hypothetical protein [Corynebacterium sp.]MDO5032916.1 hypothetical protein [Corynebacterium sp.]